MGKTERKRDGADYYVVPIAQAETLRSDKVPKRTKIVFRREDFDLFDQYNNQSGIFVAFRPGPYEVKFEGTVKCEPALKNFFFMLNDKPVGAGGCRSPYAGSAPRLEVATHKFDNLYPGDRIEMNSGDLEMQPSEKPLLFTIYYYLKKTDVCST